MASVALASLLGRYCHSMEVKRELEMNSMFVRDLFKDSYFWLSLNPFSIFRVEDLC